jgi:alpha-galactosidase
MEAGLGSNKMKILFVFIAFFFVLNIHAQTIYDGRIGEKEILTPMPGKQPRINGAKVYGARPNKVFLYRIPCQGERPIVFSVKGLPSGLKLDAKTGIITGTTLPTREISQ